MATPSKALAWYLGSQGNDVRSEHDHVQHQPARPEATSAFKEAHGGGDHCEGCDQREGDAHLCVCVGRGDEV